jgi:transcription termination/antitermination protein NusA
MCAFWSYNLPVPCVVEGRGPSVFKKNNIVKMSIARGVELLEIMDAFAKDKNMSIEFVCAIVESALGAACNQKYGRDHDIRAVINRKDGHVSLYRAKVVVEEVIDDAIEISYEEAALIGGDYKVGDLVKDPLPPFEFSSSAAHTVRRVLFQQIQLAERESEYNAFKDRVGDIISGVVKSTDYRGGITVSIAGNAEGLISKHDLLPTDRFKEGERVRGYIYKVEPRDRGPQIFLSRAHAEMVSKLFVLEVPEVYDGIVTIKGVAREAGAKSKIAVSSIDVAIDPVRACVGPRGNRVQAVSNELNGEKIDVVLWHEDLAQFTVNSLVPASVEKVVIHQNSRIIEVVVPEGQLSLAVGRRGQNVRLASRLVGWEIRLLTAEQESEKRLDQFQSCTNNLVDALDVDEILAQMLIAEGFGSVEALVKSDEKQISLVEGVSIDLAKELLSRAKEAYEKQKTEKDSYFNKHGVDPELFNFLSGIEWKDFIRLVEYGIKSIEDLGEITLEEFKQCVEDPSWSSAKVRTLLVNARKSTDS